VALGLSVLACDGHSEGNVRQDEAATGSGGGLQVSHAAVEVAQQYNFPPVPPNANVGGPFDGPQGSIFYADNQGRLSFFQPREQMVYLGQITQQGQLIYTYAFSAAMMYRANAQGQLEPINQIGDDVMAYPYAEPILTVVVQWKQAHIAELQRRQGSEQMTSEQAAQMSARDYERLSAISRIGHQTNMNILRNIGSSSCTAYYDGPTYVGCW
jgi:hypothetical protein